MDSIEVSVKLPKTVLKAAKVQKKELSQLLQQALAIELYRRDQVSLGKAAEIAGLTTKREMMRLLEMYNVPIDYTADDLEQDLKILKAIDKP
ncbi:MAG: UPF0175 family protein [Nitrosopumilaceae archaeon]|nr:UPF0175 family protein [Nitrosopumilaceae archaeon]NIX61907.1 UPF0175 family protein [Nitrosopumilaceae archaeon]